MIRTFNRYLINLPKLAINNPLYLLVTTVIVASVVMLFSGFMLRPLFADGASYFVRAMSGNPFAEQKGFFEHSHLHRELSRFILKLPFYLAHYFNNSMSRSIAVYVFSIYLYVLPIAMIVYHIRMYRYINIQQKIPFVASSIFVFSLVILASTFTVIEVIYISLIFHALLWVPFSRIDKSIDRIALIIMSVLTLASYEIVYYWIPFVFIVYLIRFHFDRTNPIFRIIILTFLFISWIHLFLYRPEGGSAQDSHVIVSFLMIPVDSFLFYEGVVAPIIISLAILYLMRYMNVISCYTVCKNLIFVFLLFGLLYSVKPSGGLGIHYRVLLYFTPLIPLLIWLLWSKKLPVLLITAVIFAFSVSFDFKQSIHWHEYISAVSNISKKINGPIPYQYLLLHNNNRSLDTSYVSYAAPTLGRNLGVNLTWTNWFITDAVQTGDNVGGIFLNIGEDYSVTLKNRFSPKIHDDIELKNDSLAALSYAYSLPESAFGQTFLMGSMPSYSDRSPRYDSFVKALNYGRELIAKNGVEYLFNLHSNCLSRSGGIENGIFEKYDVEAICK